MKNLNAVKFFPNSFVQLCYISKEILNKIIYVNQLGLGFKTIPLNSIFIDVRFSIVFQNNNYEYISFFQDEKNIVFLIIDQNIDIKNKDFSEKGSTLIFGKILRRYLLSIYKFYH